MRADGRLDGAPTCASGGMMKTAPAARAASGKTALRIIKLFVVVCKRLTPPVAYRFAETKDGAHHLLQGEPSKNVKIDDFRI